MTLRERAVMIERVLRGAALLQEELTPEIEAACERIRRRYSELKRDHDFTASAHLARVEWLVDFLGAKA
jgi:DNA-binding transcriptional regulator YdaS (Cro superfamily)